MSTTIVDMPKVCQMVDNGWRVMLFKSRFKTYTAAARHKNRKIIEDANATIVGRAIDAGHDYATASAFIDSDQIVTDDFTPEQSLTRLAYKVHGQII